MPSDDDAPAWIDGEPFSPRFGDRYYAAGDGLAETEHVFLRGNRLAERFAALPADGRFTIGETGFGTGLNLLAAWRLFDRAAAPGATLRYHSVERWPLRATDLARAHARWPQLRPWAQALRAAWPELWPQAGSRCAARPAPAPTAGHAELAGGRVRLRLVVGDAAAALQQFDAASVDAWFLDGFAPAKNPAMWSAEVAAALARASPPGATLATYTAAGWVRRHLQQAGFEVRREPGFGRKRQMSVGVRRETPDKDGSCACR
jgi:tRNA 5-methylaminomethyl-2-thiouridine biosynthesis bifunctional protein